jgi:hypothetical protein
MRHIAWPIFKTQIWTYPSSPSPDEQGLPRNHKGRDSGMSRPFILGFARRAVGPGSTSQSYSLAHGWKFGAASQVQGAPSVGPAAPGYSPLTCRPSLYHFLIGSFEVKPNGPPTGYQAQLMESSHHTPKPAGALRPG